MDLMLLAGDAVINQWNGVDGMECSGVEWNGVDGMKCSGVEWNGIDGMEWSGVEWSDFGFCPRNMLRTQNVHEQNENENTLLFNNFRFSKVAHSFSFCEGRFLELF